MALTHSISPLLPLPPPPLPLLSSPLSFPSLSFPHSSLTLTLSLPSPLWESPNCSVTNSGTPLHCPTCSKSSSRTASGSLPVMALPSSTLRRRDASGNQVARGGGGRSVVALGLLERIADPNLLVSPPPVSKALTLNVLGHRVMLDP
jgi:hypothetical protein